MARPKGSISHTETKNKIVVLRVTAREYAQVSLLASATKHHESELMRKFIEDGLFLTADDIQKLRQGINCITSYQLAKRYSGINNNNNSNDPLRPLDNLSYNKPLEPVIDAFDSEIEQAFNDSQKDKERVDDRINQIFKAQPLKEEPDRARMDSRKERYIQSCRQHGTEPDLLTISLLENQK